MQDQPTSENLKREIGPLSLAMASMNVMVGTGIFVLPAIVAEGLGATAILAYVVCGIMVFMIALCFAGLGSQTTASGGPYAYIGAAFGPYTGFISSNLYLLGALASDAALANALPDSLQYFFPGLRLDVYRIIFQFAIFAGLACLNISGVKNGIRLVVIAGFGKIIPLILLVLIALPHIKSNNLHGHIIPTPHNMGAASLLLFFAFIGFETPLINGGEIKNARRTVPLGLFGGLLLVLILYISIQVVTQGVLGDAVAAHKDAPLGAVADVALGNAGIVLLVSVMAVSILGSLSGEILAMPRIMFAAARNQMLPKALAGVHPRYATPHIAIMLYALVGFILSVSGGFRQLAIIASASSLLIYFAVTCAAMKLKTTRQTSDKSFRIPGGRVVPVLAALSIIWLLSHSSRSEVIGIAAFVILFSAIYLLMLLLKKSRNNRLAVKARHPSS